MDQYSSMELSTQIVIHEALRRGIIVEILDEKDNIIRLKKGDKAEYIKQATKTSIDSYIAPILMENKQVTKLILEEQGLNVPKGIQVYSLEEGLKAYDIFKNKQVVIKPNSTNFGKGVVILADNSTESDYKDALQEAFLHDSTVLIESFFEGKEYRFLVMGGEVVAILHRVPANVTGNGVETIAELVEKKNQDPLRGEGYKTPLEKIKLGQIEKSFLNQQGLTIDDTLDDGQIVYLRENSNISTGGDSIDFTDNVDAGFKELAVKAANLLGAKISGIDIIITDIKEKPSDENYCIIELNFNPAIHIHDYPFKGKNRGAGKKFWTY